MGTARARLKRWREGMRWLRRISAPIGVPLVIGVLAAVATAIFGGRADPGGLNVGLATLITVNAVVVGLVYSTMRTVMSLTAQTEERDSYVLGVIVMVVASILGVLTGIVHLVWTPEWADILPFAAFCLVGALALVPVLAIQERIAQAAEAKQAAQSLTADDEADIEELATPASDSAIDDSGLLRLRHREFVADPSDPFRHDVLGREPQVKAFCAVLTGIEAPAVLSLDGGWGTGKTAFVRMCSAWMRSEASPHSSASVVVFNAWTQSYTGEPLKDVVEAVTSQITDADDERRRRIARLLEQQAARVASGDMVPDGVLADGEGPRRDIARFKKTLRSFVTDGGGRLVVFIDELDRCRPAYAVGVLEKVRHIFDVAGVVVVLAVNRAALSQVVGGAHGPESAESYLRRFVDQSTHLTDPSDGTTKKFLEYLYEETGISSRMKRNSYTRHMFEILTRPDRSSLRDLEQSVHRAAFVLSSIRPASDDDSDAMQVWEQTAVTLMILRDVSREAYRRFVSGYGDAFDAGRAVWAITNWGTPIEVAPRVMDRMELVLLLAKRNGTEPILGEKFWNRYKEVGREEHGERLQELRSKFLNDIWGAEPEIEHLAGLIEMTIFDAPAQPDPLDVAA